MSDVDVMLNLREAFKAKEATFAHKRWATEEEALILYTLVKDNRFQHVVEIGTANGWTAAWFGVAGANVHTFDLVDRQKMYLDDLFPFKTLQDKIHFVCGASPAILTGNIPSPRYPGNTLFFIDGDHTHGPALADFNAVMEFAQSGDVIAQHDAIGEVGSRRVWERTIAIN